ncbi:MAG: C39 family peptidase [Armatimonadetes bacterium]|nr:C39 family peptidase [Armatimonadota bacterium]
MRLAPHAVLVAVLALASAAFAQTTSPRSSTSVFDLQTALAPVALDANTQYVSGTGIRLTSTATSGIASFTGTNAPFLVNNVVPSWNLDFPEGTGARTEVRAVNGGTSTIWYEVARMGYIPGGIKRNKSDSYGYIDIDTLMLYTAWPRIEYRVTLYTNRLGATPTLRLMSLCYADTGTLISYSPLPGPGATTSLPVPWRSQYWVPDIGDVICGPTSLTMAEDYYGCNLPTATVAADCYDDYNDLYGNWPMIAQGAARHGFKAYTFRANGQQPLRDQFAAGNAVIMSMAYSAGELTNSPIPSTNGHLVLMVGVTSSGDYICNDPAGADSRWDHVVYNANQIAHVWLYHAGGVLIAVMPNLVYGRYPYYTYQAAAPIVTDTRGRIGLFARSIAGETCFMRQTAPNGGWSGWTNLGGTVASDPVAATNRLKGNTVFARFTDGNLYYRAQVVAGGSWSDWASLGGPIQGEPAVGKSPDGRLDIFCRMSDGSIHHKWEASGGGWQAWESLGGIAAGDPVVALTWEGRQELYVRGVDGALYWKYQANNGSWPVWASLGGPIVGQPAMGRASDGRTEVFCRFADGTLRYNRQASLDVGTSWLGWTAISASSGSDPVLARTPSGLQEMFFTDDSGQVMRSFQAVADGAWGAWTSLGGSAVGAPIVGHHDDGRLQVFVFRADGRVWGRSQAVGGAWGEWTSLSPVFFADVTPPVVTSVAVSPSLAAAGDPVLVQVSASDNLWVQTVTANGIPLAADGGIWSGSVPADAVLGSHSVLVEVQDAAGNVASDSNGAYTTAPVYSTANRAIFDELTVERQWEFLFMVWGKAAVLDSNSFTVDDGSGKPVTVYCPSHGLTSGRYVIVRGILQRPSSTDASLIASSDLIRVLN